MDGAKVVTKARRSPFFSTIITQLCCQFRYHMLALSDAINIKSLSYAKLFFDFLPVLENFLVQ